MERRKDSGADEQDVQNERNDRTREVKTVESPRNEVESRKKRHRENWKKRKKKAGVEYRSARERLNGRQSYRGGRGPTEETQRCRNNRGTEREATYQTLWKKTDGAAAGEERKRKEKGLTGR